MIQFFTGELDLQDPSPVSLLREVPVLFSDLLLYLIVFNCALAFAAASVLGHRELLWLSIWARAGKEAANLASWALLRALTPIQYDRNEEWFRSCLRGVLG